MTDFDSIWRTQDEIRTVVNAVLGECIWNLSYNEQRMAIELELTKYLEVQDGVQRACACEHSVSRESCCGRLCRSRTNSDDQLYLNHLKCCHKSTGLC